MRYPIPPAPPLGIDSGEGLRRRRRGLSGGFEGAREKSSGTDPGTVGFASLDRVSSDPERVMRGGAEVLVKVDGWRRLGVAG